MGQEGTILNTRNEPTKQETISPEQRKNIEEVFKLNPTLRETVLDMVSTNQVYRGIKIELGRSKNSENLGIVQNINVYYKGELIIDSDTASTNKTFIKLFIVTKEDGTSYVGDIALPEELRNKGLGIQILQKVADTLDTKIVPTYLSTGGHTSDQAKNMWTKVNNEITPNHDGEKLYAKYLKTIFPDSKIQDIVWHGSHQEKFKEFDIEKIGDLDGGFFGKGFYFSKTKSTAEAYQKSHKTTGSMYATILNLKNPYQWKDNQRNFNYIEFIDLPNTPKGHILINTDYPEGFEQELLKKYNEKYQTNITSLNSTDFEYADELRRIGIVGTELLKEKGYDGSVAKNPISKEIEYVAFNPNQIHILGSQNDLEQFEEFVSKNESIETFLKKSGLEHVPKIETKFYFHTHATKEDGEGVVQRLKDVDIFIPENAGWDEDRLETWKRVSAGKITPERALEDERGRGKPLLWNDYFKSIFQGIYDTKKEIILADIESDNEIFTTLKEIMIDNGSAYANAFDRSFSYEDTLSKVETITDLESTLQKERELYIVKNIKEKLLQKLQENKELREKETLKILLSIGSFHTNLYHEMKKVGNTVSREFPSAQHTYDPRVTVERVAHFKGIENAQPLLSKVVLGLLLKKIQLFPLHTMTNEQIHKIFNQFSGNNIEELFNLYKESESDDDFGRKAYNYVVPLFMKKSE